MLRLAVPIWATLCGLYFLWEAVSYRGFFQRLAEFQIGRLGTYVPMLTYLVLFGLAVVPLLIIARILLRRSENAMDLPALFALRMTEARRLRRLLAGLGVTAFSVATGFGIYALWLLPDQSGELQTISASEFGTIPIRPGPARIAGGELGTIIFFGQDWIIGDDRMAFSPYRPPALANASAQVFVQLEATSKAELGKIVQRPSWSGIIVEGGLPGPVRVLFNQVGIGIAAPYYTLYQDDYALKIGYWLQATQWFLLAVLFVALFAVQSRTIKGLIKRRDESATEHPISEI